MEEESRRVLGEGTKEAVEREIGEEAVRAKTRKTEPVPSQREVEEHNLDHGVLRSWCPHCVNGRAESRGHVRKAKGEGAAPTIGVDYVDMHSEQEKEDEKGMPIIVIKDSKTKMIMAKVVPSKGVGGGSREEDDRAVSYRKVNMR